MEREAFLPVGRCRSVWLRLEWIEPVLLGKGGRVEREALPWCCQSSSYLIQPLHILSSTYEEPPGQPIERRRFASNTAVQVGTGSLSIARCTLYHLFYVFLHKLDVLCWSFVVVFVNATLDVFATFLTNCAAMHFKIWTCASPRMKQMVIHNNVKIRLVGRAIFKVMNPECTGCLTFFDIFPWLVHWNVKCRQSLTVIAFGIKLAETSVASGRRHNHVRRIAFILLDSEEEGLCIVSLCLSCIEVSS